MNVTSIFRRHAARHAADPLTASPVAFLPAPAPQHGPGPSWPETVDMPAVGATVTWPATGLRTTPEPAPGPCPCGMHPEPPEPGTGPALLSCYPGVTEHIWELRVTEGAWDDIPALWDSAYVSAHQPARKCRRNIHRNVRAASRRMSVAFDRHPGWVSDPELAADLNRLAARMEADLAEEQRLSAERWGTAARSAA